MMWVFGYGSLMWDRWEVARGCTRRSLAAVCGYRRMFNKASVKNWGTKTSPCPTLNLAAVHGTTCRGMAFEFSDNRTNKILAYLKDREGKGFTLREMPVRLESGDEVSAFVPMYEGPNVINDKTVAEVASLVTIAAGTEGSCIAYVTGIAEKLAELGIDDPAVSELLRAVKDHAQRAAQPGSAPDSPQAARR